MEQQAKREFSNRAIMTIVFAVISAFTAFFIIPPVATFIYGILSLIHIRKNNQRGTALTVVGTIIGFLYIIVGINTWL